jgi:hypothetical protein
MTYFNLRVPAVTRRVRPALKNLGLGGRDTKPEPRGHAITISLGPDVLTANQY